MNPELATNKDKIAKVRSLFKTRLLSEAEMNRLGYILSPNTNLQPDIKQGTTLPEPKEKNGSFPKLTQEDIDKIGKATISPSDKRLTKQDAILIKTLLTETLYTDIVDIARKTDPAKRDYEIQYLLTRIHTLNFRYLFPAGLKITQYQNDPGLLRLVKDREVKTPESSLLFTSLNNKDALLDREKSHIMITLTKNAKGSIIEGKTLTGKKLRPILIQNVRVTELPTNAIADDKGGGKVLVHEYNNNPVMQKVKPITYFVSSDQQVKLIKILLSERSMSMPTLFSRFSTPDEPLSYRNTELLISCVNKYMRQWGVEASFDETAENLNLEVIGGRKPTMPTLLDHNNYPEMKIQKPTINKGQSFAQQQADTTKERLQQINRASLLARGIVTHPGKNADIFYYIPSTPISKDKLQYANSDEVLDYYIDIAETRERFIQQMRDKTIPLIDKEKKSLLAEKHGRQYTVENSSALHIYPAPESVTKDKTHARMIYEIFLEDFPSEKGLSIKEIMNRMNERLPEIYRANEVTTAANAQYLIAELKKIGLYIENIAPVPPGKKRAHQGLYRLSLPHENSQNKEIDTKAKDT
ncbi:MAG TPA: hypothetical protein PKA38_00180 [Candidatus Levybacteria bacterium]|nr:hypothetical protein [Candidatus Levybacteria bacterium]